MANDNTMGAPTEGLGQTVTFTASGAGGMSQASGPQRQALRNDSRGGGAQLTARALQVPPPAPDAFSATIMKLGGDLIKPHLEAERTAAYVSGMQKAAQGEAITEIVDEQPWYSKVFGPTSLVDGARAYTANAKAASMAAEMEAKMPDLRKMGSEDFSKYATEQLLKSNTGDSATDMMIMQQAGATLPAVLKGQAKAHLRYQQEQLELSIKDSATSNFANLGIVGAASRQPGATKESADLLGAAIKTIEIFTPPAGMLPELHDKYLAESAIQAISGGNFDAYTLLKDSGKLSKMEPAAAYHIERAFNHASQQAKLNIGEDLLMEVADFRALSANPAVSREDIAARAAKINEAYSRATGDPTKYVSNAATLQELEQLRVAQAQEQARLNHARVTATTKEEKAAAEIAAIGNLAKRVAGGDGTTPYLMASESKSEQKEVWDHLRTVASPSVRLKVMVEQAAVSIDETEKNITEAAIQAAKTSGDPALLYQVYTTKYLPLVIAAGDNREAIAAKYAGEFAEDMYRYHELAQGKPASATHQAAFYQEVVTPRAKPLTASKKNTELVSALTTLPFTSWLPWTKVPLRDPEGYAAELAPKIPAYVKSTSDAINSAELASPLLNRVGGYHWRTSEKATKLVEWIGKDNTIGINNLDKAFTLTVEQYSAEAGITDGGRVGQGANTASGEPTFYIMGTGSDGKARILPFMASDLNKVWKSGKGRLDVEDFRGGPALTNLPPDDMPSPYDSDEKWLAYRKRQAARKLTK